MSISPAYAELGGGIYAPPRIQRKHPPLPSARGRPAGSSPGQVCSSHMYDPVSGWCGCGIRDDGKLAEGSPAWRASVEKALPRQQTTATPPSTPSR